jgi:hypothetical protein
VRSRGWFPLVFPKEEKEKIIARKNLFFLHEKGTREFLDKEDESTDQYVFFSLSGVRVRSRREYKSLQT